MSRGGYYDFNILVDRNASDHLTKLRGILQAAYKLGYDTVAVNTVLDVESEASTSTGKRKKGDKSQIPAPLKLSEDFVVNKSNTIPGRKFKILQRLTFPLSDPAQTYKLTSNEAKQYDILAVQPLNEKALQVCVNTLDVDLITFQMSVRIPFLLRSPQVGKAFERGMFFEITYAPAFIDEMARRYAISGGRHIVEICRGKNLIVSSEAKRSLDLRGPYDVINLCNVFGLKEPETAKIISANGRALVLKSECRQSGKGVFVVTPLSQLPEEEKWKSEYCRTEAEVSVKDGLTKETIKKRKAPKKANAKLDNKKLRTD